MLLGWALFLPEPELASELASGASLAGGVGDGIGLGKFSSRGGGSLRAGLKLFAPALNRAEDRVIGEDESSPAKSDTRSLFVSACEGEMLAICQVIRPPIAKSHFTDLRETVENSMFCVCTID